MVSFHFSSRLLDLPLKKGLKFVACVVHHWQGDPDEGGGDSCQPGAASHWQKAMESPVKQHLNFLFSKSLENITVIIQNCSI